MGTGERIEAFPNAKFGVEIENIITAEFTEASGLEAEIEVHELIEGGNNSFIRRLPGRVKFPNVTLKRGVIVSNDLWSWFEKIMNRKIERQNITIVLYSQDEVTTIRRWYLENAYPIKWTGPSFKASDNAISIESLEFAHEGMTVDDG